MQVKGALEISPCGQHSGLEWGGMWALRQDLVQVELECSVYREDKISFLRAEMPVC